MFFLHTVCAQGVDADAKDPSRTSTFLAAEVATHYTKGSITSVETADHALAGVEKARTTIEAQFAQDERACYPTFFTAACLEKAKERRRFDLSQIRPVELEADTFKRREKVVARDQALADKRAQEEAEAPQRRQQQLDNEKIVAQKTADREQAAKLTNAKPAPASTAGKHVVEHDAKSAQRQQEENRKVQERTANIEAYRKKTQEAEERQREIAVRKAEKERERTEKEASAAKQ